MATVKFRLRAKTGNSQIYVRFSISRSEVFETKTGLTINSADWSFDNAKPKQTKAENKNLASQLNDLSSNILKEYNADFISGANFSTDWLKSKIEKFFNRPEDARHDELNDDLFSVYLSNYSEWRKIDSRTKKATDQKFIQLQTKINEFEKSRKIKIAISDIDKKMMLEFRKFLIDKFNMMESSANRTLKNVKTVLLDARDNGKTINHQINNFSIENISAVKVFLSFAEIKKIKEAKLIGSDLQHAKDWLIIGCFTGQRVSDLLRMTKEMIFTKTDAGGIEYQFIELTQEKTGREVTIPLHDEVVRILKKYDGDFPPTFGKTGDSKFVLFNRYIKKVCEKAGINNIVKGRVFNDATKRNEITETEKHNLTSSHICRRSFATNFYGDKRFTTAQLMAITGHKTETVFLSYIGKTSSDHAMQTAKTFREIENQQQQIS